MHNLLSGKNLLMIVDGLYPEESALGVPEKWTSSPFTNDWCSSVFMSLDPVAIESVCHDFLRTEYNGPTIPESRPNWDGVDDYLHQAADSSLWPDGIVYDPDNDGILIRSLGVHEHWDNSVNKLYTRNLGTGDGIELVKVHEIIGLMDSQNKSVDIKIYPNPVNDYLNIEFQNTQKLVQIEIRNTNGVLLENEIYENEIQINEFDISRFASGVYLICINNGERIENHRFVKL